MEKEVKDPIEQPQDTAEATEEVKTDVTAAPETNDESVQETVDVEKTPRSILYERIRTSRPDANYDENEDEYFNQANSLLDELETGNTRYKDLSDKLMRRFQEDPDEAQAILDYMDGKPLIVAIRENMGDEALTMKEGDEGWDAYQQAGADRKKRYDEQRALIDEITKNSAESDEVLRKFSEENKLDDAGRDAIIAQMQKDLEDLSHGRVSEDILKRYLAAANHDSDVEGALEQGEINGRNQAIDAERKRIKGSGLPNGAAGGNASEDEIETTGNSTADWLSGRSWKK